MADIFISYAREDLERVRPIVRLLEDAGLSVFWDRTIPAGQTWRQFIGRALDDAKCVIVAWSKDSIESDWVQEEADEGRRRKILIPITIDDVIPPLGFRSVQHEDFNNWNGKAEHTRAKRLLQVIKDIPGLPTQKKAYDGSAFPEFLKNDTSSTRHSIVLEEDVKLMKTMYKEWQRHKEEGYEDSAEVAELDIREIVAKYLRYLELDEREADTDFTEVLKIAKRIGLFGTSIL